ncbi:hypothetical protein ACFLUS_05080, partial [Chloroflexota bacterium]
DGAIHCRRCGVEMDAKPNDKRARPGEYCPDCEPFRGRERYKKWNNRNKKIIAKSAYVGN